MDINRKHDFERIELFFFFFHIRWLVEYSTTRYHQKYKNSIVFGSTDKYIRVKISGYFIFLA